MGGSGGWGLNRQKISHDDVIFRHVMLSPPYKIWPVRLCNESLTFEAEATFIKVKKNKYIRLCHINTSQSLSFVTLNYKERPKPASDVTCLVKPIVTILLKTTRMTLQYDKEQKLHEIFYI